MTGLQGNNPLDYFAALGVQVAYDFEDTQPRLWWTDDVIPKPCIDGEFSIEDISKQVMKALLLWRQSPMLDPADQSGKEIPGASTLKMERNDLRLFLKRALDEEHVGGFCMSLVAEGSIAGNGKSKPTDLYFLAGQQKFLKVVSELINDVDESEVVDALQKGSRVPSQHSTLMLDIADDPVYALTHTDPSKGSKYLNRGVEALAILGLSRFPVYGKRGRTLTQGCGGTWKESTFDWPIWEQPSTVSMVRSLLFASTPFIEERSEMLGTWSVLRLYRSKITRSDQGGYGTFKPPSIVWQRPNSRRQELEKQNHRKLSVLEKLAAEADTGVRWKKI